MSLEEHLISVIVPIFNVGNYLQKCLKSIADQSYKNIEVLLVDDGSTDASGEVAEKFSENYDNFFVFHKDNEGVSSARNFGLERAHGEYVCFIDSDDFLQREFIYKMHDLITRYDAEISCCNFFFYFPKLNMKITCPFKSKSSVYSSSNALKRLISGTTLQNFVWNKMFKRRLFRDHNIRFDMMCFEDVVSVPQLFYYSNNVVVTSEPLYYYVQRKGSALHSINADNVEDYIRSFGSIRNFLEQQKVYDIYSKYVASYAKKVMLMKNIYIFNLYLKDFNFKNLAKNLKNSSKSINFFLEEEYTSVEGVPEMPFRILPPTEKK